MTNTIDSKKYLEISNSLYFLIDSEMEKAEDIELLYPKLVIMYEFFRLIRGEAFTELREPTLEYQTELYKMEEALFTKLKELKSRIPANSSKARFYFDNLVSNGLKI